MIQLAGGLRRQTAFVGAIAIAWAIAIYAELSGLALRLHHHSLYHSGLPFWQSAVVMLAAWQVMTAAMMLPSSLPMIHHFQSVSSRRPRPAAPIAIFVMAYFTVWSGFAIFAWSADYVLHSAVHAWPWLAAHDQVVAAGVFGMAAAFQFSALKDACLRQCRHPAAFLLRFYRSGLGGAFELGVRHGLFCLGCCWALMLVMFAAGVAHLYWMAVLGLLMVMEKTAPAGQRLTRPAGVGFGLLALMALVSPGAVPGL